jgi:TRAP-type C4-dicarboxylate transport system permease small subunit
MTTGKEPLTNNKGFLQRLLHYTNVFEDGVLVLLLAAMIIIAGVQILLRNVFETGFAWGDPLLRIMVLWVGLLGAMIATRKDNHISIDILTRYLSSRSKRISALLSNVFTLCICAVLTYHGARFVIQDQEAGIIAFSGVPAWWFELIIPVGFAVMSLRYAVRCVSGLRGQP